jgi:type I restriction enzyme M protein
LSDETIQHIAGTFHKWQQNQIENIPEFCYSARIEEIEKKDFSLVPSEYIEFVNRDENIDFDEKMQSLKTEFVDLLKAEASSKNDLLIVFKELGYEIKL